MLAGGTYGGKLEEIAMIDLEKLKPILEGYKAYFPSHWDDEKYKWEAVKHFQDHWNIDAENFGDIRVKSC